jgi:hypothetical protein
VTDVTDQDFQTTEGEGVDSLGRLWEVVDWSEVEDKEKEKWNLILVFVLFIKLVEH